MGQCFYLEEAELFLPWCHPIMLKGLKKVIATKVLWKV
jgi:hypothetical protein